LAGVGKCSFCKSYGGTRRFSELHRALVGVSHRTLTQQLRELETHGLLRRKVHRQVPPKVEYSLTPVGETLKPVIAVMHDWAEGYRHKRATKAKTDWAPRETT
jgi:DNA-binding HxlR family transcriptional regulator